MTHLDLELFTAQLVTAVKALEDPVDVDTARAALTAVVIVANRLIEEEVEGEVEGEGEGEMRIATQNSDTCGHPNIYLLSAQTMCSSCGASQNDDESWSVW